MQTLETDRRRSAKATLAIAAAMSVLVLAVLVGVLMKMGGRGMQSAKGQEPLLVYCAVAIQPALRQIAEQFERETGTPVTIQTGPSGALETQIRLSKKGDIFIPAAESPYLDRCRQDGTATNVVRLARYRIVLALRPDMANVNVTLRDLLDGKYRYAIANEEAAAGLVTRQTLELLGFWPQLEAGARTLMPTVTGVAQAVQQGTAVDCGFVWDTTARQFKLPMVNLPELDAGRAVVAAGVLACSHNSAAAERFVNYLAAPDTGRTVFEQLGYELIDGNSSASAQ